MELAEVVNPNVAVPVVGVILCFVLVYAFGFKSPVQPPSFESDEEDSKKTKTKSKHKKKSQPNGHIVAVEPTQQVTVKQTARGRQAAATEKVEVLNKAKTPKKQQTKSPKTQKSAKAEISEEPVQPSEDNEAGEWVTAQSKKKNKRSKKGQEEGGKRETTTPPRQEEVKVEVVAVETSQADAAAAVKPEMEAPVAPPMEKKQKKRKEAKAAVKADVSLEVSPDVSVEKEIKDAVDMQIKESVTAQVEEKPKSSPKKSKKEKKAAKAAASAPEVVVKDTNVTVTTTDTKLQPQRPEVEAELIAAMEDEVVTAPAEVTQKETGDGMTPRSSKSSRKKKSKESREKYSEKVPQPKSEVTESAGQIVTSSPETPTTAAKETSPPERLQTGPVAVTTEATSGTAESLSKNEEQSPVTFDEMGEWQEAKPVKSKKKRARRDN